MPLLVTLSTLLVAVLVGSIAIMLARRRRLELESVETLKLAVAENQHIPPSLHPVIDPTICIGSFSCIKACPEGDIIGVIDGVATLVEASHCIGHSRCAIDCPVGAIKLVFGTKEKGVDLPETDESFESSKPGIFIVGEVGGMGLIKNAIDQGLRVGATVKERLGTLDSGGDLLDVAIVGGGPAGIACAVACKEKGISFKVFEQETLGGCVAHYPRGKVVMSEQIVVPYLGRFGRALLSKEELLGQLQAWIGKAGVTIDEGTKVEGVTGDIGDFTVKTSRGEHRARIVVIAIGLRGSPRKLGAEGEDSPKVTYRLIDPEQYHGQRVLVVGGGDSAVEAAIQLAEESTAKVSISYRQDSFNRCKPRNRDKIGKLIEEEKVRALFSTEVTVVEQHHVVLKTQDQKAGRLKNDAIIVSVGGELPTNFLKSCGVEIRKYASEEKVSSKKRAGGPMSKADRERRTNRRLALTLAFFGVSIITCLFLLGGEYYWLPKSEREAQPLHDLLKPAGLWGHGVGVIATLFMMSNFIYVLRKRWKPLKGKAPITTWLTFHMFVGIMSPLVIAFHAAFMMNNLLAVWTWAALTIVVGTGVFGRFLFGLVPAQAGRMYKLSDVRERMSELEAQVGPMLDETTNSRAARALISAAQSEPLPKSFLDALFGLPRRARLRKKQLKSLSHLFIHAEHYDQFTILLDELARVQIQAVFYGAFKRLFRTWLVTHVVLAVFMVFLIAAHVSVSLYLGFNWIFGDKPA
jgi:thioredoxin reductase/Pyruvate/2-oxoacid:ferredoxin oxidoreductase delta subunit